MRRFLIVNLICLFWVASVSAMPADDLLKQLKRDISDGGLDKFSLIEAAFILSGAESEEELQAGIDWYDSLLNDIREKNLIQFDKKASAERLFMYFHSLVLKNYRERATTLFDIKNRGEFNCVSATVLFNLTCDDLGFSVAAFETPTHVYTIFTDVTERLMVENTSSMGFNIMKNLKNYSQYLARFYPKSEVLKIGLDRLYYHENSRGREISNLELLGLICYNKAVSFAEKTEFKKAYQFVQLAQLFNADSRSNEKFEINLYYRWGKKLFDEKSYYQAFEVMADAAYRYPEDENFAKNCRLLFLNSLMKFWRERDWDGTKQLISEFESLELSTEKENSIKDSFIDRWISHWKNQNNLAAMREAQDLKKRGSRP